MPFSDGVSILDLGTGSGVLLLSLVKGLLENSHRPFQNNIHGTGVDLSPDALSVAESNSERHCLQSVANFVVGDIGDPLSWSRNISSASDSTEQYLEEYQISRYDLIICNPPYSAVRERNRLSLSAKKYEPSMAIFADETDSLRIYRLLATSLQIYSKQLRRLETHRQDRLPILILEVGNNQDRAVKEVFASHAPSWQWKENLVDFKGLIRSLVFELRKE